MSHPAVKLNLQLRTTLLVFGALLFIGIPAAGLLLYTEQQDTIAVYNRAALTTANLVWLHFSADMQRADREHFEQELAEMVTPGGLVRGAVIFSANGRVYASSNPSDKLSESTHQIVARAIETGEPKFDDALPSSGHLSIVLPLMNEPKCRTCHSSAEKALGAIGVEVDREPLRAQLNHQLQLMAAIAGVTILAVGVTLTYALRRAIINPVARLASTSEAERERHAQLYHTGRLASIGELAAGIAHELNNPLTSIIGFSELLAQSKDLPQNVKEDVELINREAKRTAGIVKNLLTFARRQPTSRQPTDVNAAIRNVLSLRAYEQKVHNIEVVANLASDLPPVMGDAFQLQQVFMNIVINAEYFMTEAHGRGTLTVSSERAGNTVRISFADDGPGISQENLGRLFTPFFTTKEVGKGTGLGLSICHGIVTEHGGRIRAESEPGKGATFIIELPVGPVGEGSSPPLKKGD
ncbi:MAG: hypothetical protein HYX85_02540 [Chloroflexi bacterium]|nr:hypothetical protein [Chloroflexota bacterium]